MSFLQRLEMMHWTLRGYRNEDDSSDSGGGSDDDFGSDWPTFDDVADDPEWDTSPPSNDYGDDNDGVQFNPNVGAPTFDAPSELEESQFLTDSSGEIIRDSSGGAVRTPTSLENYAEQQEREDEQRIQEAAELRRQQEAEIARQSYDYFQPGMDTPLIEDYFEQYSGLSGAPRAGVPFNPVIEDYFQRGGDETGRGFTDYVTLSFDADPDRIANIQGNFYEVNPTSGVTIANNIGQFIGGQILGALGGGFLGDLAFALGGKDLGAVQGALYADAAGQGLGKFGASRIFENANVLRDANGNYFINDTLTNPFTGEFTNNIVSLEEKTAQTIAFNEAQQANQSSDDYDVAQVGEIVSGSSGDSINWRDYRGDTFSLSPQEIVNAAIGGVDFPPEVVDAARFSSQLVGGVDPLQAALNVYGDNITSVLPEGYQRPTEVAVRVGLGGENRVDVLGDVYGEDLNLDNPLGRASVDGLSTYDQTGDSDAALQDFMYTYIKEGGLQGDVELPNVFEGVGDLINTPDWLKGSGLSDIDILEYLPRINGAQFNDFVRSALRTVDPTQLKEYVPKIDLSGMNWKDLDQSYGELIDLGFDPADLPPIDLSDIPDIDLPSIDLPSFDLGFGDRMVAGMGMTDQVDFGTDAYRQRTGAQDDIAQALLEDLDNPFLS